MSSTFCSEHLQVVLLLPLMAQWSGQHGAEETLQGDGGSPDSPDGYGSIPMKIAFLVGWTSILTQLWLGVNKRYQGFDPSPTDESPIRGIFLGGQRRKYRISGEKWWTSSDESESCSSVSTVYNYIYKLYIFCIYVDSSSRLDHSYHLD